MASPIPAPGSASAPKYWRDEVGGQLRIAVENYLFDRVMTIRDVAFMRAYFRQWINSPVWDMNPAHNGH
jgi:hypothetical protein